MHVLPLLHNCLRKERREGGEREVKKERRNFPGDPVVKTPRFHCRGHGFDPWWANEDLAHAEWHGQKKKKKERNGRERRKRGRIT